MKFPKKYKRSTIVFALMLAFLATTAGDCDGESEADKSAREWSDGVANTAFENQPPHEYDATQARENLIAAQDAMALGADTWTVQTIEGKGKYFECPSRGLPLPFGTQLTPPDKIVDRSEGDVVISQIEPYLLFPPADVRATLANCVLPNGDTGVFYSEPDITTYTFDVVYDPVKDMYVIPKDSEASVKVTTVTKEEVNVRDSDISSGSGEG